MPEINEQLDPALEGLEPKELWKNFNELRQIPRPSKEEEPVMEWLLKWANKHGFETTRDAAENICIKIPATKGEENMPTVCLQGHADMVCVAREGVKHDFEKDPIQLKKEGDLLKAQDTTLGADNGIGLAAAMAIATDPNAIHPPLEILVTRDEEDNWEGVEGFDPKALGMKSTLLINLDSEDIGDICLDSAGIQKLNSVTAVDRRIKATETGDGNFYEISISNMPGGHSGIDINRNRGNAIIVMAQLLSNLPASTKLISIEGGAKKNAIPGAAKAVVFIEKKNIDRVKAIVAEFQGTLPQREIIDKTAVVNKFAADAVKAAIELTPKSAEEIKLIAMTNETKRKILSAIITFPNGVSDMDPNVDGLPETSANLGTIETADDKLTIGLSVRSKIDNETESTASDVIDYFKACGFKTEREGGLNQAWVGNNTSKLVDAVTLGYAVTAGKEAKFAGVHGALEVGAMVEKFKKILNRSVDAVSIGPTIKNNHSPDEYVDIPSVSVFYEQLKETLGLLCAMSKEADQLMKAEINSGGRGGI